MPIFSSIQSLRYRINTTAKQVPSNVGKVTAEVASFPIPVRRPIFYLLHEGGLKWLQFHVQVSLARSDIANISKSARALEQFFGQFKVRDITCLERYRPSATSLAFQSHLFVVKLSECHKGFIVFGLDNNNVNEQSHPVSEADLHDGQVAQERHRVT